MKNPFTVFNGAGLAIGTVYAANRSEAARQAGALGHLRFRLAAGDRGAPPLQPARPCACQDDEESPHRPLMSAVPEVSALEAACGLHYRRLAKILPRLETIPDAFYKGWSPWCRVAEEWFEGGALPASARPREGIDDLAALRVLAALLNSTVRSRQHLLAGVAYLMSQWFSGV